MSCCGVYQSDEKEWRHGPGEPCPQDLCSQAHSVWWKASVCLIWLVEGTALFEQAMAASKLRDRPAVAPLDYLPLPPEVLLPHECTICHQSHCHCLQTQYSEDSINGTPFVQCLVSHSHKNPTYRLCVVWYCEFWFHQNRPIYIRIPSIYRTTYRVLTVVKYI